MLQLNPPLQVYIVGKGPALAHGWVDYGAENHLLWICADDKTGEVWTCANPQVRLQWNVTMGRRPPINSGVVADQAGAEPLCEGDGVYGESLDKLAGDWGLHRERFETDLGLRIRLRAIVTASAGKP